MKLKRIIGIIIILIICQLLLSYYIYEYTMFEHPTGKIFPHLCDELDIDYLCGRIYI